nr:MAG TPA: hypothetical protein [Caudoviricetes sp.]
MYHLKITVFLLKIASLFNKKKLIVSVGQSYGQSCGMSYGMSVTIP